MIIVGVTEEVTTPSEARRLDLLGVDTWAPGEHPRWVRTRARTVSGRRIVDSSPAQDAEADASESTLSWTSGQSSEAGRRERQ